MNVSENKELFELALKARNNAYAPYSNFKVGAALLTKSGKIYVGCNMENSSYGLTICAERNAVTSAIAAGEKEWSKIVIVADGEKICTPCGACRQVLYEHGSDMEVVCANLQGDTKTYTLKELLPDAFDKDYLKQTGIHPLFDLYDESDKEL